MATIPQRMPEGFTEAAMLVGAGIGYLIGGKYSFPSREISIGASAIACATVGRIYAGIDSETPSNCKFVQQSLRKERSWSAKQLLFDVSIVGTALYYQNLQTSPLMEDFLFMFVGLKIATDAVRYFNTIQPEKETFEGQKIISFPRGRLNETKWVCENVGQLFGAYMAYTTTSAWGIGMLAGLATGKIASFFFNYLTPQNMYNKLRSEITNIISPSDSVDCNCTDCISHNNLDTAPDLWTYRQRQARISPIQRSIDSAIYPDPVSRNQFTSE